MIDPTIFSKYEKARIVGARALQISMGAPLLLNLKILPITIKRPLPKRH